MSKPLLTTVEFINILNQFPPNLLSVCRIVTLVKKRRHHSEQHISSNASPHPDPRKSRFPSTHFFQALLGIHP